ncbi:RimK family alpha-L-glutamate ligase [Halorubrum salipaludis]|uniref:RimK family alpha-L-glutamate ligase n=1 Tax=Halorubrum salipaludis TaxID=2032630 RepID=A0A2A2F1H0_9EURY|nr:RimK family alpha-L-glutamate ligase [Halorubrum salipaludis]PAU78788.1 RimK family alpha-L-glutamate ligase [Halorubrum salipaludis]
MLRLAMTTDAETFERVREPLADRGIAVEHVQAKERSLRVSGSEDREPADPPTGADGGSAAERGEFAGFDAGFVYPSRLMEGAVVDARLSVPWVNDREAVLTSRNKAGVLAALDDAGLPTPRTTLVSNPVDEAVVTEAAADFSYPVVVKPNSATRGVGVATATDLDSLLGVVDYLNLVHDYRATGDKSYLLQEFLPDARDYRAMVVDGAYVGAVERKLPADALAEGRWKHNVHRGAEATGIDLPDRARELAERTAAVLGIDYLGVDLLETDGRLVVNETNARPTVDAATKYESDFYDRLAGLIERTAAEN